MYSVIKSIQVLYTYCSSPGNYTEHFYQKQLFYLSYIVSPFLLSPMHLCEFGNFIHFCKIKFSSQIWRPYCWQVWSNLWRSTTLTALCAVFTVFKLMCSGNYTFISCEWPHHTKEMKRHYKEQVNTLIYSFRIQPSTRWISSWLISEMPSGPFFFCCATATWFQVMITSLLNIHTHGTTTAELFSQY